MLEVPLMINHILLNKCNYGQCYRKLIQEEESTQSFVLLLKIHCNFIKLVLVTAGESKEWGRELISLVRNSFLRAATQTPNAYELPAGPEHLNVQLCFNFLKPRDTSHSSSSVWSEIFSADNDAKLCFPWFPNACFATGISHHPEDAAPLLARGQHLHRHQPSTPWIPRVSQIPLASKIIPFFLLLL